MMNKKIIIFIFGLLSTITISCTKNSPSGEASATQRMDLNNVAAGNCITTKMNGEKFSGDTFLVITNLQNQYFGEATETIYSEGTFPTDYVEASSGDQAAVTEQEVLANAIAWGWNIEPKQDMSGNWTLLSMYKVILYKVNSRGYRFESREVKYGDKVSISDTASGIKISCSLPTANGK